MADLVSLSPEAQEWHRIIRTSVRECRETWHLSIQGWSGHRGGSGNDPLSVHGPHPPSDGGQSHL